MSLEPLRLLLVVKHRFDSVLQRVSCQLFVPEEEAPSQSGRWLRMTTTLKLQKCSSGGGPLLLFPLQFFTLNLQNTLSPSLSSSSVSTVEKPSSAGQAQSAACLQLRAAYINLTGRDAWETLQIHSGRLCIPDSIKKQSTS